MNKDPHEMVCQVTDERSFLAFAKALADDRANAVTKERIQESSPDGPDGGGWENVTIEDFLLGGIAWAEDSDFGRRMAVRELEMKDAVPWQRMAAFLIAGRVYE